MSSGDNQRVGLQGPAPIRPADGPGEAIAWTPDEAVRARAQLTAFLKRTGCPDFAALHRRSVDDIAWFTEEVLRFLEIRFARPYSRVVDLSRGPAWPVWCVDGLLNISESCLDRHRGTGAWDSPAVIWEGEEGESRSLTFAELHVEVELCAAGLRACGLGKGDAVGLHLPMIPETAVALLALARIGAVAVPLFSGYGPSALAARLQDVKARALFTCDAFPRRGKAVPAKPAADEAAAQCPAVEKVFVVRRLGTDVPMRPGRDVAWEELRALGAAAPASARAAEPTSAEDPLLVLYTSGTTGRPKGILHSHCGFPVKAAQDMAFGTDVGPGDRIAWVTDIGWMMGPWLLYGAALRGAAMVLYDGAPDFPGPDRLWALCARHRIGILGISPSLVRALSAAGPGAAELPRRHDLSALRILASTGEPWNPEPWAWLFEAVGRGRLPIVNYSGGTEISGGILMGNPLLPLKPCGFPAPCPGIASDVADESGRSVRVTVGELVIRKPWIGMARGFLGDPARYLETYWSRWPDTWVHGDWARVDADGHWYILGRSDDTLKVAGKRVGPAEVESLLVGPGLAKEAAVIGVPDAKKGQAMVALCVRAAPEGAPEDSASGGPDKAGMSAGAAAGPEGESPGGAGKAGTSGMSAGRDPGGDAALEAALKARVAAELGKPLQPERVAFVPALPRTRNAKVMRRVVRAAWLGEDPGDVTALENPESLAAIRAAGEAWRAGAGTSAASGDAGGGIGGGGNRDDGERKGG